MFFDYNFNIKIIHNDCEIKRNQTHQYLINVNIFFESSSADTQTQNDVMERFEQMMIMKIKIMQLFINLLHSMWKKIIETAIYFYNWTLKTALKWKNFYKTFHIYVWRKKTVLNSRKPQLHHFQTYECKCYVLIKFQNDSHKAGKFQKLDFRIYIEFLIEYVFINVYHVWISHKQKIIFVPNVIFDEQQMWDGKTIKYIIKNIIQFDETISIIKVFYTNEIKNQQFGKDDFENIINILTRNSTILAETDEADATANKNAGEVANKKDKQVKKNKLNWMTNQYFNLNSFIAETMLAQFIFMTFNAAFHSKKMIIEIEKINSMNNVVIKPIILNELKKRQFNRFYNFKSRWVFFKMQKAFIVNFKHSFFLNLNITKTSKAICMKKTFGISWNNKLNNTNKISTSEK